MSKKLLSTLLVLTLVLGACVLPVSAFAETAPATTSDSGAVIDPSLDVALYTVPMKATVSILYAIKSSAVASTDGLKLVVVKGTTTSEVAPAGTMTISGEKYIIFEYTGLTASEMRTTVSAYIRCGEAQGNTVEYSVAAFAEAYAAKGGQYVELVSAMLAYGDAVAKLAGGK